MITSHSFRHLPISILNNFSKLNRFRLLAKFSGQKSKSKGIIIDETEEFSRPYHVPVMLNECCDGLFSSQSSGKLFVDCTLGGGGHTTELLKRGAKVVGIDQVILILISPYSIY